MTIQKCTLPSFSVIGKAGSTEDGPGFVQRLWQEANAHYAEVSHFAKTDESGKPVTNCPFCGSLLELDTRSTEQKAYEAFKGRYKAQAEYNEAERRAQQEFERERSQQAEKNARSRRVKGRVIGCLTPV